MKCDGCDLYRTVSTHHISKRQMLVEDPLISTPLTLANSIDAVPNSVEVDKQKIE